MSTYAALRDMATNSARETKRRRRAQRDQVPISLRDLDQRRLVRNNAMSVWSGVRTVLKVPPAASRADNITERARGTHRVHAFLPIVTSRGSAIPRCAASARRGSSRCRGLGRTRCHRAARRTAATSHH
jgi:hypothetical protein